MRSTITTIACAAALVLQAQGPMALSLKQAMDMAATQSYAVQNSALEAEKARAKIKEVTAIGLPQVSATGSLSNYIKVPTQVIPNFFGDDPETIEVQFGIPWSLTGGVQLNQLLFDGSYLIGLKASRELKQKSDKELEQAAANARAQAAKAYLSVLAAEEGVRLIGETLPVVQKAADDAAATVQQGLMESTDADRLTVQLEETRNAQRNLQQQALVARAYLALVLGMPSGAPLQLTDALQPLIDDPAEKGLADAQLDVASHVDAQVAQSFMRLSELDVRNKKAAYLPQLSGFINYQQQYYSEAFNPGKGPWFPASLWGLQLNVPIFSSGMRQAQVKQARLSLDQANVNVKATEQRLMTEHLQQQATLRAAQDAYETGRRTLALGKSIYERVSVKFGEGVGSSFELTQENANYLTAQQNYIQRIVDLLQARTDMRKALDLY